MKDSAKTIIFATVLGVVCAGLLAAANQVLKPYYEMNKAADKLRNVFNVLGVPYEKGATSEQLLKLTKAKDPGGVVGEITVEGMTIYTYDNKQAGLLYAVEFEGPGLWGPVKGLLCLKSDLKTVYNIAFYEHAETPGLGAEIEGREFCGQFKDKTIAGQGEPGIVVAKPKQAKGDSQVDGISGATLTCDKVSAMINTVSKRILAHREAIEKAAASPVAVERKAGNE
jgi:Na+-transporting NADH:ubiquinone oxidoreductase subunit C